MDRMVSRERRLAPIVEMSLDWLVVGGLVAMALWAAMNLALWRVPEVVSIIG